MNIYLDYLIKNFGGFHLKGVVYSSELIEKYDITRISKAYHDYATDINSKWSLIERAIRHYIGVIGDTKDIEKILKCKCSNGKKFTNKEFLMIVKIRAEENKQ